MAKLFYFFVGTSLLAIVLGHGYIKDPAARNSCGQYGFSSCKVEWTMDEKNCGGFAKQWDTNGGKCGVCGDAYDKTPTLVHPGAFATGTITRTYQQGQDFDLELHITVSHKGWSEFRIGDIGTPPITQDNLVHLMKLSDGGTRWMHPGQKGFFTIRLKLPAGLTCKQCVIQWWWKTGNSWGCDGPKDCGLGKGRQETFVNCADVKIIPTGGVLPTNPPTMAPPVTPGPTAPPATNPSPPSGGCKAIGAWQGQASMDAWCVSNCNLGNCPAHMCKCT